MNYGEFMAFHRKNPHGRLYLLHGEESYFIDKGKNCILGKLFPDGVNKDEIQELPADVSVGDLIMNAESLPFFYDKNVIIVQDMTLLNKKAKEDDEGDDSQKAKGKKRKPPEEILSDFFQRIPEYTTLIFINRKTLDKRKKLYKAFAKYGKTLEADPLKSYQTDAVGDWLQGKLQELHKEMDREAFQYFLSAVTMMQTISLGYLDKEMEKLALYMGKEQRKIERGLLIEALSSIPEVSGFAMADAISEHNVKRALYLFKRQLEEGVAIPVLLGILVRHVRQLWQIKGYSQRGMRGKALGSAMGGMNPFIADKLAKTAQSFTEEQLKKAFLDLAEADFLLKTGRGEPVELESIIIDLCRRQS